MKSFDRVANRIARWRYAPQDRTRLRRPDQIKLMKRFKFIPSLLLLTALLSVAPFFVTGCATTGKPLAIKPVPPAELQMFAQLAGSMGSQAALMYNPAYRPILVNVEVGLQGLIDAGSGNVADLQKILSQLPVGTLQGTNGAILISGGITLIDLAGQKLTQNGTNNVWAGYVLPIATGLHAGLAQTLGQ